MPEARTPEQRKADTLEKLNASELDAWVSTASTSGPHLVPLSVAWHAECLIIATEPSAVTTRNLAATGRARLGLGETRDVVVIDAEVVESTPANDAANAVIASYLAQCHWDPRDAGAPFVVHVLRPVRILAWREVNEIAERTLMRDGHWVV
jgi:hypothetical protein